jgi:kynurenine formamidase
MDLMELYRELKGRTFVDLTHSFCPGIPHYPALHDMERRDLYTVENDGFWVEKMTLVGQWGTHFLYEERGVTASGHETADTDCGVDSSNGNMVCEHYVLAQDRYQIELMANLDKVPPKGALIIAAFPKLQDGSGFPARCFAILP